MKNILDNQKMQKTSKIHENTQNWAQILYVGL